MAILLDSQDVIGGLVMDDGAGGQVNCSESTVIDMAVESWRFSRVFMRLVTKLESGDATRYANQLRYFQKRIEDHLDQAGLKLVNVEGQLFDPGVAATAINAADFLPEDTLMITQMIEPIIMDSKGLKRQGAVVVSKVEK